MLQLILLLTKYIDKTTQYLSFPFLQMNRSKYDKVDHTKSIYIGMEDLVIINNITAGIHVNKGIFFF